MRLSKKIQESIVQNIYAIFGEVDIYLFGSRVDDTKRGGDIDIAIDVMMERSEFRRKKAKFFANLIRNSFDYSVDIVNYNTVDELLSQEIKNNHYKLTY
jgi:predicted nucleotidyltransferase